MEGRPGRLRGAPAEMCPFCGGVNRLQSPKAGGARAAGARASPRLPGPPPPLPARRARPDRPPTTRSSACGRSLHGSWRPSASSPSIRWAFARSRQLLRSRSSPCAPLTTRPLRKATAINLRRCGGPVNQQREAPPCRLFYFDLPAPPRTPRPTHSQPPKPPTPGHRPPRSSCTASARRCKGWSRARGSGWPRGCHPQRCARAREATRPAVPLGSIRPRRPAPPCANPLLGVASPAAGAPGLGVTAVPSPAALPHTPVHPVASAGASSYRPLSPGTPPHHCMPPGRGRGVGAAAARGRHRGRAAAAARGGIEKGPQGRGGKGALVEELGWRNAQKPAAGQVSGPAHRHYSCLIPANPQARQPSLLLLAALTRAHCGPAFLQPLAPCPLRLPSQAAAILDSRGAGVETAAEPRPNAYVPEDLCIPKPFGAFAPFKPAAAAGAAAARHARPPVARPVVI
jgi:hypothetical protein